MTESTSAGPGGSKGVGFTNWLVNKAAGVLERTSSRRGFILGSAMVGSAVAVAGCAPGTQPGTPYAHITDCAGGLCTDGYTEFCCTINNGINACPPGTFVAGWWRADYSSFCNGTRYYMDCNESCCGPNLGNGFCAGCHEATCGGDCNARRIYANYFRYGQCHQEIGLLGPIACRLVTCTPPYTVAEYACTTALAVDNATAEHAPAYGCTPPPPPPPKTFAAVLPSAGAVVSSSAGTLTAFGRLSNGLIGIQEFDGTSWSTSSIPFGITASGIGVTTQGTNTYVFIKSNNDGYFWNQRPSGGSWSSTWTSLGGGFISDPSMATDSSGSYAFGRGNDDAVWFCRKNGTGFTLPQSLNGAVESDPAAVSDATGLYVFARAGDKAIWYRRFVGGTPGPWTSLGGTVTSDPAACGTSTGPIVAARGPDNAVYIRYALGQNGSSWQSLGGFATSDPALCSGPSGTFVFVRSGDNALYYSQYNGGTSWTPWAKLGGGSVTSPIAISDSAGVSVLFIGFDRAFRTFRLTGGSWGSEQVIGGEYAPVRGGG